MGITTVLLTSPPAITFTVVKQSVAMSVGNWKLIWNRPGYPKDVPAYNGVIWRVPAVTMKLPAAVWSPELPPLSFRASAPPPVPHSTMGSPGGGGRRATAVRPYLTPP